LICVAIIGVGNIGAAVASRLLDKGAKVILHNRSPERCAALQLRGAHIETSPRAATAAADFVILSLNSADIVEQVVFGADGVECAASADKLLLDFSSIDPKRTATMATRLESQTAMGWVDSPLSGGAPAALRGSLTLMLGGSAEHVARAEPLLDLLSSRRTHLGPSGAGQTVKLINQVLCACGFLAVAEAVRFAEGCGVDATRIPAALAGGRADSRILQEFMAKMALHDTTPTGSIENMLKDLEAVQAVAHAKRIPMPVTGLITELHRMLVAGGLGSADNAEYTRLFDLAADRKERP
jgi:2-hydroxy-3-oxopropionate reductase